MILLILLLVLLVPMSALAVPPEILVINTLDDVHCSGIGIYESTSPLCITSEAPMVTPSMDAMAAAGTRLNNMRVGRSCALSRTMMIGAGSVGRSTNLHGTNGLAWGAPNTIEIDPYADNLVRRANALGYTTAFFGKSHMGKDNFSEPEFVIGQSKTFLAELGFDYAEAVIRAQPGSLDRLSNTMTAAQQRCLGHNSWVSSDLAGNLVWETGYTSDVISDAVKAYINGITPGEKHVIFVSWSAPHQPSDYAQGTAECGGAIGQAPAAGTAYAQDDRPPGDITSFGFKAVYRAGHEYVDARIGEINALLDLSDAGDDMSLVWGDNGVYMNGAFVECFASDRVKGTGFPCGTNVPFIVQGGDVARGEENDGLFHTPDIPKTIGRLLGGNGGGIRDGMSFADCMTGTGGQNNATCLDHPVTHYTFWRPNGGQISNPGNIQRAPRTDDVEVEWVEWERFAYSTRFNGNWTLRRRYLPGSPSVDGLITFYEEFYETTLTDPYLASSNPPRASTQFSGIGKLELTDFTAITANEQSAFLMMQAELDSMDLRDGRIEPNFSGVTY